MTRQLLGTKRLRAGMAWPSCKGQPRGSLLSLGAERRAASVSVGILEQVGKKQQKCFTAGGKLDKGQSECCRDKSQLWTVGRVSPLERDYFFS